MKNFRLFPLANILLLFLQLSCSAVKELPVGNDVIILPPEELYGELFYDVQSNPEIFPDSKTFVDAIPKSSIQEIRHNYSNLDEPDTRELKEFINKHFIIPKETNAYITDSSSINLHINELWDVLKRPADEKVSGTLLPLPNPYIVPGGRFREIYYWDSYFTMLGLQEDGETETIRNMVDNFSFLIDTYGFIPNGNRSYYMSRSQPPFYSLMVGILAEIEGEQILVKYLSFLQKEYDFWMRGEKSLSSDRRTKDRVVLMPGGEILNRYWDAKETPRPESYREDVETANEAVLAAPERTREEVYRNLRAAAESGWDFSSRWLTKEEDNSFKLSTIHTTDILPVDLNSLLYHLEFTLHKAYLLKGEDELSDKYKSRSEKRMKAINKYFWNEEEGYFMDHNFKQGTSIGVLSLAGIYPLFFRIATQSQSRGVYQRIEEDFLKPGGVVTTPYHTGQQWDAPNGWAPLQWMTITGLRNYGHTWLATLIKERWLQLNKTVYNRTYKMLEKYNVEDISKESGGGEYPTQDGFGWTNGVYQKLSRE
ncbi:MAG TPA: alpha,alpha-trehalase TreA [Gillisia sp.]|nr:alpha,alpha-trehalase TreA [Gillisia sp.]